MKEKIRWWRWDIDITPSEFSGLYNQHSEYSWIFIVRGSCPWTMNFNSLWTALVNMARNTHLVLDQTQCWWVSPSVSHTHIKLSKKGKDAFFMEKEHYPFRCCYSQWKGIFRLPQTQWLVLMLYRVFFFFLSLSPPLINALLLSLLLDTSRYRSASQSHSFDISLAPASSFFATCSPVPVSLISTFCRHC